MPGSYESALRDAMPELASAADRAPSPLGHRPWRLRIRHGDVELLADTTSEHVDPRQTAIGCGAALFNLRLAVGHLGLQPLVTVMPDPGQPDLLARVSAGERHPLSAEDETLYFALPDRRTRRHPFSRPDVPAELVTLLTAAARSEGADLVPVPPGGPLQAMDDIVGRIDGQGPGAGPRAVWDIDSVRCVLLLVTDGDELADWLRAGQALQRVLLTATASWLQARFHNRVLELPVLRAQVRERLCPGRAPQMVLELGQRSLSAT